MRSHPSLVRLPPRAQAAFIVLVPFVLAASSCSDGIPPDDNTPETVEVEISIGGACSGVVRVGNRTCSSSCTLEFDRRDTDPVLYAEPDARCVAGPWTGECNVCGDCTDECSVNTQAPKRVAVSFEFLPGAPVWGLTSDGVAGITDLAVTPDGGVVAVGSFSGGALRFEGGDDVTSERFEYFFARLSPDHEVVSAVATRRLDTVTVGPAGEIVVSGTSGFIARVGEDDTFLWTQFVGSGVPAVAIGSDGRVLAVDRASIAEIDMTSGTYVWSFVVATPFNDDRSAAAVVDSNGNLFAVGSFVDWVDFDGSRGLISNGGSDAYLIGVDTAGEVLIKRAIGGLRDDIAKDIAIMPNGRLIVIGDFDSDSVRFDSRILNHEDRARASFVSIHIRRDGSDEWAQVIDGATPEVPGGGDRVKVRRVSISPEGNALVLVQGLDTSFTEPAGGYFMVLDGSGTQRAVEKLLEPHQGWVDAMVHDSSGIVIGGSFEGSANLGSGARDAGEDRRAFVAGFPGY